MQDHFIGKVVDTEKQKTETSLEPWQGRKKRIANILYESHIREHVMKLWRESQQGLDGAEIQKSEGSRQTEGTSSSRRSKSWGMGNFGKLGWKQSLWNVKIAGKKNDAQSREDRVGWKSSKSCPRVARIENSLRRVLRSSILYPAGEEEPFLNQVRILIKSVTKHKINWSEEKVEWVKKIA